MAQEQKKEPAKEAKRKAAANKKEKIIVEKKAEFKEGECGDETCPRHGHLKTKGRIFEGKVVSTKAAKTAVVEIQYLTMVPKYERYEKRRSKLHVHIPPCYKVNEGDTIKFMECRKLSKTKAFVIVD